MDIALAIAQADQDLRHLLLAQLLVEAEDLPQQSAAHLGQEQLLLALAQAVLCEEGSDLLHQAKKG